MLSENVKITIAEAFNLLGGEASFEELLKIIKKKTLENLKTSKKNYVEKNFDISDWYSMDDLVEELVATYNRVYIAGDTVQHDRGMFENFVKDVADDAPVFSKTSVADLYEFDSMDLEPRMMVLDEDYYGEIEDPVHDLYEAQRFFRASSQDERLLFNELMHPFEFENVSVYEGDSIESYREVFASCGFPLTTSDEDEVFYFSRNKKNLEDALTMSSIKHSGYETDMSTWSDFVTRRNKELFSSLRSYLGNENIETVITDFVIDSEKVRTSEEHENGIYLFYILNTFVRQLRKGGNIILRSRHFFCQYALEILAIFSSLFEEYKMFKPRVNGVGEDSCFIIFKNKKSDFSLIKNIVTKVLRTSDNILRRSDNVRSYRFIINALFDIEKVDSFFKQVDGMEAYGYLMRVTYLLLFTKLTARMKEGGQAKLEDRKYFSFCYLNNVRYRIDHHSTLRGAAVYNMLRNSPDYVFTTSGTVKLVQDEEKGLLPVGAYELVDPLLTTYVLNEVLASEVHIDSHLEFSARINKSRLSHLVIKDNSKTLPILFDRSRRDVTVPKDLFDLADLTENMEDKVVFSLKRRICLRADKFVLGESEWVGPSDTDYDLLFKDTVPKLVALGDDFASVHFSKEDMDDFWSLGAFGYNTVLTGSYYDRKAFYEDLKRDVNLLKRECLVKYNESSSPFKLLIDSSRVYSYYTSRGYVCNIYSLDKDYVLKQFKGTSRNFALAKRFVYIYKRSDISYVLDVLLSSLHYFRVKTRDKRFMIRLLDGYHGYVTDDMSFSRFIDRMALKSFPHDKDRRNVQKEIYLLQARDFSRRKFVFDTFGKYYEKYIRLDYEDDLKFFVEPKEDYLVKRTIVGNRRRSLEEAMSLAKEAADEAEDSDTYADA